MLNLNVYLITHSKNGYVHCAFDTMKQATLFIEALNARQNFDYHIIVRTLHKHWSEVGV